LVKKPLSKSEIERKLIKEYIKKNKAIDKRLNEQLIIHFLTVEDSYFKLTKYGKDFLKFSEIIKKIYGIKN
jgi:hypothetical protein